MERRIHDQLIGEQLLSPTDEEDTNRVGQSGAVEMVLDEPLTIVPPLSGFEKLQAFVADAAQRGVHHEVSQSKVQTNQNWANQWNFLGIYLWVDHATYGDIAKKYKRTHQNVQQIIMSSITKLYEAAPEDLRAQYPFEEFAYKKPRSLEFRLRASAARGGKLREVTEMARSGKSTQEIKEELGLSSEQMTSIRTNARIHNVDIDYKYPSHTPGLVDCLLDPEVSYEKRQKILDGLERGALGGKRFSSALVKLTQIQREAGLEVSKKNGGKKRVVDAIRNAGLPVRLIEYNNHGMMQRYAYIARVDAEAVLRVLQEDSSLDSMRKKETEQ